MGQQTRGSRRAGQADTSSGRETSTERRQRQRAARERDEPFQAAYEAGRRGDDPAEFQTDDRLWATYQDGQSAARQEARGQRREQLTSSAGAKAGSLANDGAGFLLGLFAYALLANYLRNGVPGVKGWLAAKFLNRPMDSSGASAPTKPARPSGPSGGGM